MMDASERQGVCIAKWAFGLMLGGLFVPMLAGAALLVPGATLPQPTADLVFVLGVGASLLAEVLALVLGALGREHPLGCAAMIGAVAVIVVGGLWLAAVMGIGGVSETSAATTV